MLNRAHKQLFRKKEAEKEAGRNLVFALFFGLNQADVEAVFFFMNNKTHVCIVEPSVAV